jgi:hypothetical protein
MGKLYNTLIIYIAGDNGNSASRWLVRRTRLLRFRALTFRSPIK